VKLDFEPWIAPELWAQALNQAQDEQHNNPHNRMIQRKHPLSSFGNMVTLMQPLIQAQFAPTLAVC
jgi:hypothetical protein